MTSPQRTEQINAILTFVLWASILGGWWPAGLVADAVDPNGQKNRANQAAYEEDLAAYEEELDGLDNITVFKTRTGERYHRPYHYRGRNDPVGLGSAIRSGLTPCGTCRPVFRQIPDRPTKPKLLERTLVGHLTLFSIWGLPIVGVIVFWNREAILNWLRGLAFFDKRDYDKAIAHYTEAIRLDPKNAETYCDRGDIYLLQKGDYDSAIADYTEAIRLKPTDAEAYRRRGLAYQGKGQLAAAERDFAQAKRLGYEP